MKTSSTVPLSTLGGHSAMVDIYLLVNGQSLPVAQMGADFVLLESPVNHPATDTTVVFRVDGSESRWNVRLPQGVSADEERVEIAPAA